MDLSGFGAYSFQEAAHQTNAGPSAQELKTTASAKPDHVTSTDNDDHTTPGSRLVSALVSLTGTALDLPESLQLEDENGAQPTRKKSNPVPVPGRSRDRSGEYDTLPGSANLKRHISPPTAQENDGRSLLQLDFGAAGLATTPGSLGVSPPKIFSKSVVDEAPTTGNVGTANKPVARRASRDNLP